MLQVLIVDDVPTIRDGLALHLGAEPLLRVVGEASDGREALALVRSLAPDVVVMDVRMPVLDGMAATALLREGGSDVPVVLISVHVDPVLQARAHGVGAHALVSKCDGPTGLLAAILSAASGAGARRG